MTELLIASAIGFIVILVVGQTDVTRVLLAEQARGRATQYMEAVYAMNHMLKQLENADRVVLVQPGNNAAIVSPPPPMARIKFRVPTSVIDSASADVVTNYTWKQYNFTGGPLNQVVFYDNTQSGCSNRKIVAFLGVTTPTPGVPGVLIHYLNTAPAPPGGDPTGINLAPPLDNNVLGIDIAIANPKNIAESVTIRGKVTLRSAAHTKTLTGLTVTGFAPVPLDCP